MVDIAVAAIAAAGMLLCQILISWRQNSLILYRLAQLENKQTEHNDFIKRTYNIERDVDRLDERLSNLEKKERGTT